MSLVFFSEVISGLVRDVQGSKRNGEAVEGEFRRKEDQ